MSDRESLEARLARLEKRLKQLEYNQRALDVHLAGLENSIIFRILRRVGRPLLDARTGAMRWLMRRPLGTVSRRLPPAGNGSYSSYTDYQTGQQLPELAAWPRFSLLVRADGQRGKRLEDTIASVCGQTYPHWELCVFAHGPAAGAIVDRDPRIRVMRSEVEAEASAALNQAAAMATGDYLAVIEPGDRIEPDTLHWLASKAPADIMYTDEDRLDEEGRRSEPVFKPDWSPDLLLSCMYIGKLMAVSRATWEQSGGFGCGYEGAEDYDLALRITDRAVSVRRVPRVLYHRRKYVPEAEPNADASGRRALGDALRRRGARAEVEEGPRRKLYQVRWRPAGTPLASLILCTRSPRLLEQCLKAVAKRTQYPHREAIVIQHLGHDDEGLRAVIERHKATRVPYSGPFHFSRMNNLGAQAARGEILVFLNDDIEPLEPSWLERLVAQVERPDVGVAGARLLYPSGTLQHAGVTIGIGDGCGHIGRGAFAAPYWPWLELTRDVGAVTGACLATKAELFRELGGFADEFPINYNDADLCLRVRRAGYRVVYDAGAVLRHYECQTRRGVVTFRERELWYGHWGDVIDGGDRFYSPHLTREREDLSLRAWP